MVIWITKHFEDYERNRKGSLGLRVFLLDYADYEEIRGLRSDICTCNSM